MRIQSLFSQEFVSNTGTNSCAPSDQSLPTPRAPFITNILVTSITPRHVLLLPRGLPNSPTLVTMPEKGNRPLPRPHPQLVHFRPSSPLDTSILWLDRVRTATRFSNARSALKYSTLIERQLHHPYCEKIPHTLNSPTPKDTVTQGAHSISHLRVMHTDQEFINYTTKLRHAN